MPSRGIYRRDLANPSVELRMVTFTRSAGRCEVGSLLNGTSRADCAFTYMYTSVFLLCFVLFTEMMGSSEETRACLGELLRSACFPNNSL